jgi:hypothetical protein
MGDDEVDAVLFPPLTAAPERRPVPDWRHVQHENRESPCLPVWLITGRVAQGTLRRQA